jgi:hypothetical protein
MNSIPFEARRAPRVTQSCTYIVVLVLALVWASPAACQTPTPPPTPTPTVVDVDSGTFVVSPVITLGEAGVIIALVLVSGLLLVRIALEVAGWLLR